MSFIFSAVNGSHIGQADQPIPAGTFYGASFAQGVHDMMLSSIYRMSEYDGAQEYNEETNPMVRQAEANHYAQQEGLDFKFQTDVTMDEMNLMLRRHKEKRDRDMILQQGSTDGWRIAGSMGTQFIASMLNPLDMALNFIPIVGTGVKAGRAAKLGMIGRAFERGLITEEALAARGLALKGYTASVIEGSVGNAISEIPLMLSNRQDQTGYTGDQFAMAVGLGAVFGGVINTGRLALKRAFKVHERLSPEAKENMSAAAMEDFIQGRAIDPGRVALLDDSVRDTQMRLAEVTRLVNEPEVRSETTTSSTKAIQHSIAYADPEAAEGIPTGFLVTRNSSPGAVREEGGADAGFDGEPDYFTSEYGAIPTGSPEGEWRVTQFMGESPSHHDTFNSFEEAQRFAKEQAESYADSYGGKVDTQELTPRQKLKQDVEKGPRPDESEEDYLMRLYDEQEAAGETRQPTAEQQMEQIKQQAATYKAHEEAKQAKSEADREKEIADGNTLDAPDDHHFGSVVDDAELKRIDEEIAQLEADLDLSDPLAIPSTGKDGSSLFSEIRSMLPPARNQAGDRLPDKPEYTAWDLAYVTAERYPETKALLDEMFKLDPDMRNIKTKFDYDLYIEKNARGMYHAGDDTISLDPQFASRTTLIHELNHAQTARRIREDMDKLGEIGVLSLGGDRYFNRLQRYAALTENKGIREIIDAYTKAVGFLGPEVRARLNSSTFSLDTGAHRGFANIDEFIAEGMSDPKFQQILNSIPSGKKSVLNSLFDAIKKILGVDVKEDSLLAQLLDGYKKIGEGAPRDASDFLKNLPPTKVISKQLLEKASTCIL